ncbi:MarR family winged helix-turn-helix transcriptional regulator [Oceanicoccus sp. KOV_DT_Chl]|uniref:MarR family winged helix-turn-helix transcriptional regulator n=1 Tax=Oceanicoccus sp. KOV_DT_Chl TaxID=1904639 RepID=UPI000C7A04B9|nr:MarR family winged helix-turn-helix transcriptional regulator [Oceanicoccus sp. KOV_DT_Chl]
MTSLPKIDAAYKLSNNLSRLLVELAKDFERRTLQKCHQRGHTKIRRSHSSLFSNLGFEAVRLTELAERAGITQQAMGKLVKEMERVGYVKRHVDESDKRAKIIELTEMGTTLVNDSMEIVDEVIAEYTAALGYDGILDLEKVLRKSVAALGINYLPESWNKTADPQSNAA